MKKGLIMEGGALRGMFTAGVTDVLMENNVHFDFLRKINEKTGHAIIQVSNSAENAILVYSGASGCVEKDYIDLVLEKGGKVYFSFAATMRIVLNKYSQTAAVQKTYKEAVVKAFPKATVISDPGTYVMESNWFYNSRYHLSTDGSVHRAKLLAKDILAQLAKEK